MGDDMVTTAEHTIPVEGLHFNRAKQIAEHPDIGTGELFLSAFNVPNAFHIIMSSSTGDFYVRLQYENSEPGEKSPREAADMIVTLGKNSKKVIEIKLPRSRAILEGQAPQIPPEFVKNVESALEGSQQFIFSMNVNLTNSMLREIWPLAIKHFAERAKEPA